MNATRFEQKKISNKSLQLWKVPIKTFASLFAALRTSWTKKAILQQILDIPCRSILIRRSQNIPPRCGLFARLFDFLHRHALVHTRPWLPLRWWHGMQNLAAVDWSLILSSFLYPRQANVCLLSFISYPTDFAAKSRRHDSLSSSGSAPSWQKWLQTKFW